MNVHVDGGDLIHLEELEAQRGGLESDEESTKVTECRFADDYTVFTTTTVLCLQKQGVSMRGK